MTRCDSVSEQKANRIRVGGFMSLRQGLAARPISTLDTFHDILRGLAERDRSEPILSVQHIPAREAQFRPLPTWVDAGLAAVYRRKGIDQLYSHQAAACELAHDGRDFVVVTPTASGKTLCYNLPVLNAIAENPDTRALYLFPTKALAQDQLSELHDLATRLDDSFGVFTYDGDTPSDARKAIRERGHIILTNPDMLHTGILPHHTKWIRLFENLRYIILDELHTYRGVFGSHFANVLRRLARVTRFYGSRPQFICSSATIANPGELASQLTERQIEVVDNNGAPAGEKLFVFYNPPMVNRNLGIRRSYLNEATRVAKELLGRRLQTIVFANSRLHTEVLLTHLQQSYPPRPGAPEPIRGYRGGYLPAERREIERGLREGRVRGVVSTSALELGIDIGSLDCCVMAGYAGSIASTWQRAGRAGRRSGTSCAVMVASSAPLDQFIVQHPEYFFGRSPEHAYIQPDNLEILINHLKCAAFELPITSDDNDRLGSVDLPELCDRLAEAGFLHPSGGSWHWVQEAYPADTISLRSVTSDNFVIVQSHTEDDGHTEGLKKGAPEVIGEVDFSSALTTVHPKAIYLHQGQPYHVERLDFDERQAYVEPVSVEYYTDAIRYTQVRVLAIAREESIEDHSRSHGDVLVRSQVVGFKKIKFSTNETIGDGKLELPENEMHTTAFWITLGRALLQSLPFALRDRQGGIFGLLYALESMATLLLMCDRRDLGTSVGERPPSPGVETEWHEYTVAPDDPLKSKEFFEPNLYLYDAYPGGIGFSEPLYGIHDLLVRRTRELVAGCSCANGCPSCVGPGGEKSERAKDAALAILRQLCVDE